MISDMNNKAHYDGYVWDTLKQACKDLGLDYDDVSTYLSNPDNTLAEYIRLNRFIVRGLIFCSIDAVANYLGVDVNLLKKYMNHGYNIDLAAHMIRRGLPMNYFSLPKKKI